MIIINKFKEKYGLEFGNNMHKIFLHILTKIQTGDNINRTDNMLLAWCLGFKGMFLLDSACQPEYVAHFENGKLQVGNRVGTTIHNTVPTQVYGGGRKTKHRYKKTTRRYKKSNNLSKKSKKLSKKSKKSRTFKKNR